MSLNTAQRMKFSINNFFKKCDKIRSFLADLVTLTEENLMKNFIFFSRIKVTTKTFHSCCFCLKKIQSGESNNTLLERCNISHFVNDPLYHCRANSFHLDIFAILGVQVFPEAAVQRCSVKKWSY